MSNNILVQLDQDLASLNQLKPPGASKNKIQSITNLCVNNIQAEHNFVQSLYRALKKAPATHKLGAIYVIDSVVRRWIEQAKQKGLELNFEGRGEQGTYPAAVKRVTELMPALFDDIVKVIPADQKDKLAGMVSIWEKSGTFRPEMLAEFRQKLSGESNKAAAQANAAVSKPYVNLGKFAAPKPSRPLHTPVGYPPQHLHDRGLLPGYGGGQSAPPQVQQQQPPQQAAPPPPQQPAPQSNQDVNSILASLASLKPSEPQIHAQVIPQVPVPHSQQSFPPPQMEHLPPNFAALFGQQAPNAPPPFPPALSTPQPGPQFQLPPGFPPFPPQQPPSVAQPYGQAPPPPQQAAPQQQADPLGPLRHILPANIVNDQQKLVPALKLLQDLQKDGIPMERWGPVLNAFAEQYQTPQSPQHQYGNDSYGRGRGRSWSPDRGQGRRGQRGSPVYGAYDGNQNGDGDMRGRYRDRSPMRSFEEQNGGFGNQKMQPKYIAMDSNLPADHIKVLSRTLFVGGASGTDKEIKELFAQFGEVQTCIVSMEKRHAFVKMTTRAHALNAKANMEKLQSGQDRYVHHVARQTKWGVGFGPRECCDYQRGESIIPIRKLTEADMKWLLTAPFGGTGGQRVESGMVLEEPDIEIGAGVSSKAMSKRNNEGQNHNDHGHGHGGKQHYQNKRNRDDHHHHNDHGRSNRKEKKQRYWEQQAAQQQQESGYGGGKGQGQGQQMEAYGYARPEPVAVATPPAVPGFGFQFPGQPF